MKKIYKYEVPGRMTGKVSKWLQPHWQYGKLVVWAELDDNVEEKEWILVPVGTGWEMEKELDNSTYCGTVLEEDGPYVWHIYALPFMEK